MKKLFHLLICIFFVITFSSAKIFPQANITLDGKILGHDGNPVIAGTINILEGVNPVTKETFHADVSGQFKIPLKKGMNTLRATGANHQLLDFRFLASEEKTYSTEIQLAAYEYLDEFADVRIIGDFNKFNFRKSEAMQKENDGAFSFTIDWKKDSLAYQLLGVTKDGRSINGTQSDIFVYDGDGDYKSVIKVNGGAAKIIFDPAKIIRSDKNAAISFNPSDENDFINQLYFSYREWNKKYFAARGERFASGGKAENFNFDFSGYINSLKEKIAEATDADKKFYHIAYACSYLWGNKDSLMATTIFSEAPAASDLWAFDYNALFAACYNLPVEKQTQSLEQIADNSPIDDVASMALMYLFMQADGDESANKYYDRVLKDYPNSNAASTLKYFYPRDAKIKKGATVPDFKLTNLDEPDKTFSNIDMYGKIYLIDFWATWCGPCIAEMDNLHKAYGLFKDKGFQIISLSFDSSPDLVKNFRADKYKMPWLHSFIEGGFGSEIANAFEVKGIPKPVLVNKDGTIIAVDAPLRGANLIATLENIYK